MFRSNLPAAEIREFLLWIMAISASLAGFCVAGISLLNSNLKGQQFVGLGDDLLAFAAIAFLLCTYLTFWGLRTSKEARLFVLARAIDILFLTGLTLIVISGWGIVYALF